MENNRLVIPEEILLLALRNEQGTVAAGSTYKYAIGGAILAELLLLDRVRLDERTKNNLVNVVSAAPVGDDLFDECLGKMVDAKRRASLQTWVTRFAGMKDLHHRIAAGLCRRGILKSDERSVLLVFSRRVYPEANPEPERRLVERLRQAIFTDIQEVEPRTVVLLSLANSAGLLHEIFEKKELKKRKQRLDQIINGEMTGKATKKAIEAMQAAVMVAVIIPTVITTTNH